MESTGVLWRPVWNILDGQFELLLVNPRELKRVPGRKSGTSYKDLGPDYFDNLKPEQYRRYLVKRLESLRFYVELKPKDAAA